MRKDLSKNLGNEQMSFLATKEELNRLKDGLIKFFVLGKNEIAVKILRNSHMECFYYTHDNWDGGIDYHNLCLKIPIELYYELENDFCHVNDELMKRANQLVGEGSDRIGRVIIEIRDDGGSNPIQSHIINNLEKLN